MRLHCVSAFGLIAALMTIPASAEDLHGVVKSVDTRSGRVEITGEGTHDAVTVRVNEGTAIEASGKRVRLGILKPGMRIIVTDAHTASRIAVEATSAPTRSITAELLFNIRHNLFKPLLLFFYMGFLVPILRVKFEFPYVIYQGLTIYLLIAIGWHGGEELARLGFGTLGQALGFMGVGLLTNTAIGVLSYLALGMMTRLRRVDQATVAGYYGSDSAGTFVTCLGVLASAHIAFDAYMPVMLAVMEVPGCLVALLLVSRLRAKGMDPAGTMPDEPGYDPNAAKPRGAGAGDGHGDQGHADALEDELELSLEKQDEPAEYGPAPAGALNLHMLHEVFLNPGLYLLFGGIVVGFISGLQGAEVTRADDSFFVTLFQGVLCLFLLEMGMTASRKLRDLKTAGWGYILFALIGPNVFATIGICMAHLYAWLSGTRLEPGSYVLFAVLCGAASYIAVPAVQRLAIPEASPTLPLAASLGLTFSYNVTIGIPVYIELTKAVMRAWPL